MYGDNGYHLTYIQELHLQLIRRYRTLFDEAMVILHTKDIHDISTTHKVKAMFDKIFCGNVKFEVVKNSASSEVDTFRRFFLPIIIDKYNDYDLVYYIHNKGVAQDHTNNMRVWISTLYYYNFEYFNEHLLAGQESSDIFITGGLMLHTPFDMKLHRCIDNHNNVSTDCENFTTSYQFVGGFFGIFPANYRKALLKEHSGLKIEEMYKVACTPELHFFNGLHDTTHIHHDSHINVLETTSMDEFRFKYNPYEKMDTIVQMLSNEKDINNTFTLARGQSL
jgi:hypothetical protein